MLRVEAQRDVDGTVPVGHLLPGVGLDIRFLANGIEQIVDELKPVEVAKGA